jgi:hypothetical protein
MNVESYPKFTSSEIETLGHLKDKVLSGVFYHHWNNFAKEDSFSILLAAELVFSDGETIVVSSGDSDDLARIMLNHFDIEKEKKLVQDSFKGQVKIESSDEQDTDLWKHLLGRQITDIELEAIKVNDKPLATHFKLTFGDESLLIRTGSEGDGILIEAFIED